MTIIFCYTPLPFKPKIDLGAPRLLNTSKPKQTTEELQQTKEGYRPWTTRTLTENRYPQKSLLN